MYIITLYLVFVFIERTWFCGYLKVKKKILIPIAIDL